MAREFLKGIKAENRIDKIRLIEKNDPVIGGQPSDNANEFTSNTPMLDIACTLKHTQDSFNERVPVAKLDHFLVGLANGNYQIYTAKQTRTKLGLGTAAVADLTSEAGDSEELVASQALVKKSIEGISKVNVVSTLGSSKTDAASQYLVTQSNKRIPVSKKDHVLMGNETDDYRLLDIDTLKLMINIREGLPIGHVHWHMFVINGSLPLDGREVSRAEYPELFNFGKFFMISEADWWAHSSGQWGQCSYFSVGNGSTTFRLPSIPGYVKGGGTGYQNHGLPNIYGYVDAAGLFPAGQPSVGGALSLGNWANTSAMTAIQGSFHNLTFNAQSANGIYGASSTVEVIAVKGYWQIKAR